MARRSASERQSLQAPFLKRITLLPELATEDGYPFDLPILQERPFELVFDRPVSFFVGDNGTGKSTLIEALAAQCGFSSGGGSRHHRISGGPSSEALADALRLAWLPKVTEGFFLRAESFFNLARYIDEGGNLDYWGGRPLLGQSHGQSFLALFRNQFDMRRRGLYLLDEPEAALSPSRQLEFLALLHDWSRSGNAQFIIATHSPIIMSYPGATLFNFDGGAVHEVHYTATEHYRVTRAFLMNPERYLAELFEDEDEDENE